MKTVIFFENTPKGNKYKNGKKITDTLRKQRTSLK